MPSVAPAARLAPGHFDQLFESQRLALFGMLLLDVLLERLARPPQLRVRGRNTAASPISIPSSKGSRRATRLAISTSQSCRSGCAVLAKNPRMMRPSSIFPVSMTWSENSSSKSVEFDGRRVPLELEPVGSRLHTPSGTTSRGQA